MENAWGLGEGERRENRGTCESLRGLSFPDWIMSHSAQTSGDAETSRNHNAVLAETKPQALESLGCRGAHSRCQDGVEAKPLPAAA